MVLKRMKSKFFGTGSSASSSSSYQSSLSSSSSFPSASSSPSSFPSSRSKRVSSPPQIPPMPMIPANSALRVEPRAPRRSQKIHKDPEQVAYITAENIRELRDLIRYRYALDGEIWSIGKQVKWYQQDTVIAKIKQADAAMIMIRTTLDGWDRPEYFATAEAYDKFREVKRRILEANPRNWEANPPWAAAGDDSNSGPHEKDGQPVYGYAQHAYR